MSKTGKIILQQAIGYAGSGPKSTKEKPTMIGFKKLKYPMIKAEIAVVDGQMLARIRDQIVRKPCQ